MTDLSKDVYKRICQITGGYKGKGRYVRDFSLADFQQECNLRYLEEKPQTDLELRGLIYRTFHALYIPHVRRDKAGQVTEVLGKHSRYLLARHVSIDSRSLDSEGRINDGDADFLLPSVDILPEIEYNLTKQNMITYIKTNCSVIEKEILLLIFKKVPACDMAKILKVNKVTIYRHIQNIKKLLEEFRNVK